jgi:hypothetical protein
VIRGLEGSPAAIVVYSPTEVPHFPRPEAYAAPVFRYLVDHFQIDRVFGGDWDGYTFLLLGRRTPAPGRSLLGPALAEARIAEEPRDGRQVTTPAGGPLAAEDLWPFEHVLRVVTLPDATVSVSYRLTPAPGERFVAGYGVNPEHWVAYVPAEVRFGVVVREQDGAEHEVMAASVDPLRRASDRRWMPVFVDLSPWAGRPIDLVLRVTGTPGAPPQPNRAGWADPRLVGAAPGG